MKYARFRVFIAVLLLFGACSKYSKDPNLRLARDFIDNYYIMADQNKSLGLTEGMAEEKIQSEIKLLKDVSSRQNAYHSRDIVFELKRTMDKENEIIYFYELTIKIPDLEDLKKLVNITVDKVNHKVSYFGEVTD